MKTQTCPYQPGERVARNLVFSMPEIVRLGSTAKMEASVLQKMKPLLNCNAELLAGLEVAENTLKFANGEVRHKVTLEIVRGALAKAKGTA